MLAVVSDAVWLALVSGFVAAITSIAGVVTAYISLRSKMLEIQKDSHQRGVVQSEKMNTIASEVKQIEKATNSMHESLVKATGDLKFLEGQNEEKARADAVKVAVAEENAMIAEQVAVNFGNAVDVKTMTVETLKVDKKL